MSTRRLENTAFRLSTFSTANRRHSLSNDIPTLISRETTKCRGGWGGPAGARLPVRAGGAACPDQIECVLCRAPSCSARGMSAAVPPNVAGSTVLRRQVFQPCGVRVPRGRRALGWGSRRGGGCVGRGPSRLLSARRRRSALPVPCRDCRRGCRRARPWNGPTQYRRPARGPVCIRNPSRHRVRSRASAGSRPGCAMIYHRGQTFLLRRNLPRVGPGQGALRWVSAPRWPRMPTRVAVVSPAAIRRFD